MTRTRPITTVAALLLAASAVTAIATPSASGALAPTEPHIGLLQDDRGVHVRIYNRNKYWGLRNQHVRIMLRSTRGLPIRMYGPDESRTIDGKPGKELHCCLITLLPPQGEFTFDLFPVKHKVGQIDMQLRGEPLWVRM